MGLSEYVLEGKGGFCGVACVAAMHEVSQLGHLVQGIFHGYVIRQYSAGFGRLDDGLRVHNGEVPVRGGQVVDAAIRCAQAQAAKERRCNVIGMACTAGNLLAVQGQWKEFMGLQLGAGQCGHAKGCAGGRAPTAMMASPMFFFLS